MTTTKNNEHKKLNFSSEREQNQACLNSAEHEKNQGRKVLNVPNKQEQNQTCSDSAEREGLSPKGNVPNLRFKEFQGEWEKCKLGDLTAKVGSGSTPKGGNAVYTSAGHCFVRSQNVGMGYLILDDVAHINDGIHQKHKATELKEDDVLLNITGASIGRTAIATKEIEGGNVNQHVCIIRANSKVSPKFLCNYIQTKKIQNYIQSLQTGGSREGLNFEQIRSFPISLPNMAEQNKIAQLLDKLNERIATQNKIIDKLQSLIKGLNDFLYTQYGGEVLTSFAELGTSYSGLSGKSAQDFGSGKPFITYLNVYSNNVIKENDFQYVAIKDDEKQNVVKYGDVLFTLSSETPEEVGVGSVYLGKEKVYLNSFCFGIHITNTEVAFSPYLSYYVSLTAFRKFIYPYAQGSTRFNLCKADFEKASIKLPTLADQKTNILCIGAYRL
mgnify:CR=1 FL=1